MSEKKILKCVVCGKEIQEDEQKFAVDSENHPGILGPCHRSCYEKVCKEEPDTPWTDPISGEVDYETMEEDLGVDHPDFDEEEL